MRTRRSCWGWCMFQAFHGQDHHILLMFGNSNCSTTRSSSFFPPGQTIARPLSHCTWGNSDSAQRMGLYSLFRDQPSSGTLPWLRRVRYLRLGRRDTSWECTLCSTGPSPLLGSVWLQGLHSLHLAHPPWRPRLGECDALPCILSDTDVRQLSLRP